MRLNLRRSLFVVLFALASCLMAGCGDIAKTGVKGVLQKVGAKAVENSSDDEFRAMFQAANRTCPQRIDEFTTLKEVELVDDTRAEFRYEVNERGKLFAIRMGQQAMKAAMVEHMRGNPMAQAVAERDLSVEHIYKDEKGHHVLSYTINRDVLDGEPAPIGEEQSNPFNVTTVSTGGAEAAVTSQPEPELTPTPELAPAPEPELPQRFNTPKRTIDNPAGVQGNPFFQGT